MKRTMAQKLSALLLTAVMLLALSACSGGATSSTASKAAEETSSTATSSEEKLYYNKTGFPICDEPITIKVSGVTGTTTDWNSTLTAQYVKELMGIQMDCTTYAADVWNTQYAVMLSSDSLPDLITKVDMDKTQINTNGAEGTEINFE